MLPQKSPEGWTRTTDVSFVMRLQRTALATRHTSGYNGTGYETCTHTPYGTCF